MNNGAVLQGSFLAGWQRVGSKAVQASLRLPAWRLSPLVPVLARANGGQCLPREVQARMETLFGTGFAEVRVHVSREVASLGASAVTQGSSIYFAPGRYDPVSLAGQRLLAYELAHVVQQRTGRVRNPFGTGVAIVADPGLEAEASRMALRAGAVTRQPAVAQREVAQRSAALPRVPGTRVSVPAVLPAGRALTATVLHRPPPLRSVPVPGSPVRATAVQPRRMDRLSPVRPPGAAVVQCSWADLVKFAKQNQMSLLVLGGLVALAGVTATYRYLTSDTSERESLRRRLEGNQFRITAGLDKYKRHFGGDFDSALRNLQPSDRWLDGGAGTASAIREYCGPLKDQAPQTVAVAYEKPQVSELSEFEEAAGKKFTYLSGKLFQEFGQEELGGTGQLTLITDYNGILFYTDTLSEDLQKYLDLLKNGGELYVAKFFATIDDDNGSDRSDPVLNWLKNVSGVKVSTSRDGAFKIERTGNPVVPKLKLVRSDMSKSPPEREFKSVT